MILFLLGNVLGAAYFTFKVVRVWTGPSHSETYRNTNKSLTVFAALSTLALVALFFCGVVVYGGFGRGLRREICGKEFWRRYFRRNAGRKGVQGVDEGREYVRDLRAGGEGREGREGKKGSVGEKGMVQMKRLSID